MEAEGHRGSIMPVMQTFKDEGSAPVKISDERR